jgi:hypothetical protein
MKYIQVDNLLGDNYHSRLFEIVNGMNSFPWFFLSEDVSYTSHVAFGDTKLLDMNPEEKSVGFTHLLIDSLGGESPWLPHFAAFLDAVKDSMPAPIEFTRVRLALQLNNGNDGHHNGVHTDTEKDHYAALYYFHDSSGDTVFFNEYDNPDFGTVDERWRRARTQKYTECKRVTPKQNTLFVFDGHQFHSSSNPSTNPYRIVCNLNFVSDHDLFALNSSTCN